MGAYLSEPITEKISSDEANEYLTCGASSMQGWRMSQEDAHNCILDFDTNTSLFAVYDGHGGAEVALYCAQKLPEFLKDTDEYKKRHFEKALKETFIGFDATLVKENVHAELKKLIPADKRDRESETEEDMDDAEDDIEELAELCQESRMPLNELLEKYKDGKKNPLLNQVKKADDGGASCSKPISPYLRGRRNNKNSNGSEACDDAGGSSGMSSKASSSEAQPISIRRKLDDDESADGQVSSSSALSSKQKLEKEATVASSSSSLSSEAITSNGPSSSSSGENCHAKDGQVNYIKPDSSSTTSSSASIGGTSTAIATTTNQHATPTESADCSEAVKSIVNGETGVSQVPKSQENEISTNSSKVAEGVSSSSSAGSSSSSTTTSSSSSGGSSSSSSNTTTTTATTNRKPENGEVSSNSIEKSAVNNISSTNECKAKRNMPVLNDEDTSSEDEEDASYNEDKSSTEDGEDCEMDSEAEEDETDDDDEEDDEDDIFPDDDVNDSFLNDMVEGPGSSSGCTAVVSLLVGRNLYVANAGDSRCVVCRNGEALEMSIDHKPEDTEEFERICKAGGIVSSDGRVNGGLNLSRAIGDHAYKLNKSLGPEEQMISALPDVRKITVSDGDEFMVIACDGIWNFMSSEEVVQFVKPKLAEGREKLSTICEELFTYCLADHTLGDGTGCDNMTAVIIKFKPKLLELPTEPIDAEPVTARAAPNEISAAEQLAAATDAIIDDIRKRSASLVFAGDDDQLDSSNNKRIKTDDEQGTVDGEQEKDKKQCDDGVDKDGGAVIDRANDAVAEDNVESSTVGST